MTRIAKLVLAAAVAVSSTGCPDNPYKAKTWTKKLHDPREAERAVTQLEQLGDPSAIPDLGQAWVEEGKPVRLLQVIISLARPLTPKQAEDTYMTDYAQSGRPASWDAALPFLTKALTEVDEANPRSVDSAQKAADALGEAKLDGGLDALIDISKKPVTKKLISAQVSAIRAIGKFDGAKQKAAAALQAIIDRDPPDHPRTAKDKEQGRALEEKYGLFLGVTGAAINGLSDLRVPSAVPTLVTAMYRTPELFTQIRRALVASGPTAETELRKILRGEQAQVEQLFKDKRLGVYCGDKGDSKDCLQVSAHDFYPAVILGDFYDPASVPDLLSALDKPMLPQYYSDDQPSGSTNYNAIFDALTKIGAPTGADKIRSMWMTGSAPAAKPAGKKGAPAPAADAGGGGGDKLTVRLLAISAYPFITRDDQGVAELGKIAADNAADDNLRTSAATAFARLSHDPNDVKILNDLAKKYYDASDKKAAERDKLKASKDAADKEFDAVKKKYDDSKADALKATHDNSKTAADIKAATEAAKKADEDMKAAKKVHREKTGPYDQADKTATAYVGFAHMFQSHIARIEVALRCKGDLNCFAGTLKETPDDAVKNVTSYIQVPNGQKAVKDWPKEDKLALLEGEVERAMLEIGKKGQAANNLADPLLDAAKTENGQDRLIRQSIQLALPKIAKVPCANCEQKLDAAIKAGEGKSTLGDLNLETTMLRNYFAWAGGKTPTTSTEIPDAPVEQKAPPPKKK
ncbi:MAG: hypothetical protein QM831_29535 [Kofleriaceae bacterium]